MKELMTAQGKNNQEESHWLSISDLMAGLMVVFMFIAIAFMLNVQKDKNRIEGIALEYRDTQLAIYRALLLEFGEDLKRWDADLSKKTLTLTFRSPDILFKGGKSEINEQYRQLLNEFAPRYFSALTPFFDVIQEVRIEGHTSSEWEGNTPPKEAYYQNMELSQERTKSVLTHLYALPQISDDLFIRSKLVAIGYSSSRLERHKNNSENKEASRRVNFTVITNADAKLREIYKDRS
ncbi:OmpA family protein [Endozoicomonas sp. SM1973]|uniref:OmpA family protein n=1 Tax=Spartinivicinus marinus TaxID=2994442 RepID=A0A853INU9_9GAMM|nr:OmpA family protein [Spartinivicinus marinus]MCX4030331.1 OmpA family protein [Spartinivicinus marinus]MCX4030511.1 OmpA family protein [Spartinivicinus marinus]NYZ69536.1 OmpA family protein [Spartinivicinus marinus]